MRSVHSECDFAVFIFNSIKFACRIKDGTAKPRIKAKGC